jgi:hypothetical protein
MAKILLNGGKYGGLYLDTTKLQLTDVDNTETNIDAIVTSSTDRLSVTESGEKWEYSIKLNTTPTAEFINYEKI